MRPVAIVGCGLVGGSLLRALAPIRPVLAVDTDAGTRADIEKALQIQALATVPALADAIVVLATPLPEVLRLLAADVAPGCLVTDVAGVKTPVLEAGRGRRFVGAHPMAGRETAGFQAGSADLFRGRTVAICPPADARPEDVAEIVDLWRSVGAVPVPCDAAAHDAAVARVSHLPYLVAAALAGTLGEADDLARALAAGGARDTSRVAEDASIRPVVQANPHVAALAREVGERLVAWAAALERHEGLDDALADAAEARRKLFTR